MPAASNRVVHVGHDVRVLQLLDAEVDAHRQRRVERELVLHDLRLAAALAQDPAADRHDQAGLLGERDEAVRLQQAALGVLPAQQRLEPADHTVLEAHHRLVVQLELVVGDRALEVGLQLEAGEHDLVHRGLEHPVAALAVALGDVHGSVGVADQVVGVGGAAVPGHRDAEARAHDQLLLVQPQRLGEGLDDAFGGVRGLLEALHVLQEDRELIPAEAGRRVACANARFESLGHVEQHLVAGGVAEAVVDRLEVVEVEEDHGQALVVAARARDRVPHPLDEQRAVGEVRHRVVEGLVGELLLEDLALAHVAAVQHDAVDVLVVEQVRAQDLELARAAIAVAQRALDGLALAAAVLALVGQQRQQTRLLAGRQELVEAAAHHVLGLCSRARARSRGSGRAPARGRRSR